MLITGGRVFSDATREWIDTSLALADGVIAGWGEREALEVVDVDGAALTPGFVDAHMHLESTKLWIDEFVGHGAAARNDGGRGRPPRARQRARGPRHPGPDRGRPRRCRSPSPCTRRAACRPPASSAPGATLDAGDIRELIESHGAVGVAEVMNFPGVIAGEPEMLARIAAAGARRVDGHGPGVSGRQLDAYIAAGVESDHESTRLRRPRRSAARACGCSCARARRQPEPGGAGPHHRRPRHRPGRVLHRRPRARHAARGSGTSTTAPGSPSPAGSPRSRRSCWPAPTRRATTASPPRQPRPRPPGRHPGLLRLGSWVPARVWQAGRLVAADGAIVPGAVPPSPPPDCCATPSTSAPAGRRRLVLPCRRGRRPRRRGGEPQPDHRAPGGGGRIRRRPRPRRGGGAPPRHRRIGRGFATGFGLTRRDRVDRRPRRAQRGRRRRPGEDMAAAVARLAEIGGGQVAVLDGAVSAEVPLPLAGLMSDRSASEVAAQIGRSGGGRRRAAGGDRGGAVHAAVVHCAVGDPRAPADRRRPGRRRPVRLRAGRGGLSVSREAEFEVLDRISDQSPRDTDWPLL